jgi:esterase/lipase/1-acyl-sn-glycerol-3-phosphate acyltransferase
MNRFAYRTTGVALKTLAGLLKARIRIHQKENIPDGSIIFVVNHFTRIETLFLPYHIHKITRVPAWSLADYQLFDGPLGVFLDKVGAVSTHNPDRDLLIIKSLLTGEAVWIIFPEGRMVKSKKIIEKGRFVVSYADGRHPPHTGAATLALRAEFYRQRLKILADTDPREADRLMNLFQINSMDPIHQRNTYIVPVNITYYPLRAHENMLSSIAARLKDDISDRMLEELMTEGTMLLSGVDVDIRFGLPIEIEKYMTSRAIRRDISSNRRIDFDDPIPSKPTLKKIARKVMQRYMNDIYRLTTVNHDHIFASMLKFYPFKKIDELDFKRRIFLVASRHLKQTGVYVHDSLAADQVHLLVDDRFNKFNDFITVAKQKGVVRKINGTLLNENSSFFSPFAFHRIRIDNPVAVIANEVEPLASLQRKIKYTAWLPSFYHKRQVVRYLMKKALIEFDKDYNAFYAAGESQKREVGKPFLVQGGGRDVGVLLVHGYMAAPLEVEKLAVYLGRKGMWVYVPRLKGHGTSPDDLATRKYQEWIRSVDAGYAVISSICKRVVVGGFSAGAGLALDLAARVPGVMGVFAVCPPMRLKDFSSRFVPAVDVWNRLAKRVHLEGIQMEFVENKPENPHINYFRNPLSGVLELERFMEFLEARLHTVLAPALVVQSRGDPVVKPSGSRRAFERLGSENKTYLLFNFDRHGILLGDGSGKVHRAIGDFIEDLI